MLAPAACTRRVTPSARLVWEPRVVSHLHISTTWGEAAQLAWHDGAVPVGPWLDRGGRPGGGHGAGGLDAHDVPNMGLRRLGAPGVLHEHCRRPSHRLSPLCLASLRGAWRLWPDGLLVEPPTWGLLPTW